MIYLDHAAATPLHPKALEAMLPYFTTDFFNPSAAYLPAKHVREAYEAAKDQIAHAIGAKGVDLVMTAGATESINLAFTALRHCSLMQNSPSDQIPRAPHLHNPDRTLHTLQATSSIRPKALVLATEHAAVLSAAVAYPHSLIKVDRTGLIDLADFRAQLTDDVVFVSIALANNELGTIQPFAKIAEIIRIARQKRLRQGNITPLYLHTDASQALSLIDINVARLGVDLLTLNAAKCGGPKGVGALYVGHNVKLSPLSRGGGQERGLRGGTENVPGVIGFAVAIAEAKKHLTSNRKKYQKMAHILRQNLSQIPLELPSNSTKTPVPNQSSAPYTSIIAHLDEKVNTFYAKPAFLGNPKHQLVNFVSVSFPGLDAERLIYKLEAQGILVSTGAACAASRGAKSHVLSAIGLSDAEIAGSLRISLGPTNTPEQIKTAAKIIAEVVSHEYARIKNIDDMDGDLRLSSERIRRLGRGIAARPRNDGRRERASNEDKRKSLFGGAI